MLAQGARSGVTCLIPAATDAMRLIALAALLAVPLAIAAVPQTTHQTGFAYIGFSNDGKLALTSSYYHDGEQGEFKLWNVADGRLLCTQPARYERATNAREVSPGVFEMEDERSKGPPRYLRFFVEGCRVEPMAGPSGSFSVGPIEDDKGQRVALQGGPSVQGYRPQVLATGGQDAYACVEDPERGPRAARLYRMAAGMRRAQEVARFPSCGPMTLAPDGRLLVVAGSVVDLAARRVLATVMPGKTRHTAAIGASRLLLQPYGSTPKEVMELDLRTGAVVARHIENEHRTWAPSLDTYATSVANGTRGDAGYIVVHDSAGSRPLSDQAAALAAQNARDDAARMKVLEHTVGAGYMNGVIDEGIFGPVSLRLALIRHVCKGDPGGRIVSAVHVDTGGSTFMGRSLQVSAHNFILLATRGGVPGGWSFSDMQLPPPSVANAVVVEGHVILPVGKVGNVRTDTRVTLNGLTQPAFVYSLECGA